jgi:hypothetical protein
LEVVAALGKGGGALPAAIRLQRCRLPGGAFGIPGVAAMRPAMRDFVFPDQSR